MHSGRCASDWKPAYSAVRQRKASLVAAPDVSLNCGFDDMKFAQ